MSGQRLRAVLPASEYTRQLHDNHKHQEHQLRTRVTASLVTWLGAKTICDPACGDASIVIAAHALAPLRFVYLGDLSPRIQMIRPPFEHQHIVGDLHDTLATIGDVDLVILTEVLEHIEDPLLPLQAARQKAKYLIASSPIDEPPHIGNAEHAWSFSEKAYHTMLTEAGWETIVQQRLVFTIPGSLYDFQIWCAR